MISCIADSIWGGGTRRKGGEQGTGEWEWVGHLYPATDISHETTEMLTFIMLSNIWVSKIILQMSMDSNNF